MDGIVTTHRLVGVDGDPDMLEVAVLCSCGWRGETYYGDTMLAPEASARALFERHRALSRGRRRPRPK